MNFVNFTLLLSICFASGAIFRFKSARNAMQMGYPGGCFTMFTSSRAVFSLLYPHKGGVRGGKQAKNALLNRFSREHIEYLLTDMHQSRFFVMKLTYRIKNPVNFVNFGFWKLTSLDSLRLGKNDH